MLTGDRVVPPGAVANGAHSVVTSTPAPSTGASSPPANGVASHSYAPPAGPPPGPSSSAVTANGNQPHFPPPTSPPPSTQNPQKPLLAGQKRPSYTAPPNMNRGAAGGPGTTAQTGPGGGPIYHYQNPVTGQTVSSPLPPDHPAMQCLQQGRHVPGPTHFGLLGIVVAIVLFPVGLLGLCIDRRVQCERCGEMLNDGC